MRAPADTRRCIALTMLCLKHDARRPTPCCLACPLLASDGSSDKCILIGFNES
jgi:hypothetical protein